MWKRQDEHGDNHHQANAKEQVGVLQDLLHNSAVWKLD
jgi:hypothetical protein